MVLNFILLKVRFFQVGRISSLKRCSLLKILNINLKKMKNKIFTYLSYKICIIKFKMLNYTFLIRHL